MKPNELISYQNILKWEWHDNESLLEMLTEWHNIYENRSLIKERISFPIYLNYEKYGNGINRYLQSITEHLKCAGLIPFEGRDSFIELNMEYKEGTEHPSLIRLMYLMEEKVAGEAFRGVVLIHIDEWCGKDYRLEDKRFLALLQYLEERRSDLMIILQTTVECHSLQLEKLLQQHFNIRIVKSVPISIDHFIGIIEDNLQMSGFGLSEDARLCIEDIGRRFIDVEVIDSHRQMELIFEDIIFEYIKNPTLPDRIVTCQHLKHSIRKVEDIIRKKETISFGFDINR
ncbi:MAG: hypothetical protein K0S47_1951 [Herbinix sp.]|jgi:hypothetical protein|nr:hypothetical protein [Herbinix sp.]